MSMFLMGSGKLMRPSCGSRRLVMSIPEITLKRETSASARFFVSTMRSASWPSTRKRSRRSFFLGSMWMSEARSLSAMRMSESVMPTSSLDSTSSARRESVRSAWRNGEKSKFAMSLSSSTIEWYFTRIADSTSSGKLKTGLTFAPRKSSSALVTLVSSGSTMATVTTPPSW